MIKFIKVREVKDPIRDEKENAGIDFFVPEKSAELDQEIRDFNGRIGIHENYLSIPPHQDILIPAGIKSKFDTNIGFIAANKSGVATKNKLIYGAELIDTSYQGEWHFHLINWSDEEQRINYGQKILQFVPVIISTEAHEVLDCSEEEFFEVQSNRGADGFGSTGV